MRCSCASLRRRRLDSEALETVVQEADKREDPYGIYTGMFPGA